MLLWVVCHFRDLLAILLNPSDITNAMQLLHPPQLHPRGRGRGMELVPPPKLHSVS